MALHTAALGTCAEAEHAMRRRLAWTRLQHECVTSSTSCDERCCEKRTIRPAVSREQQEGVYNTGSRRAKTQCPGARTNAFGKETERGRRGHGRHHKRGTHKPQHKHVSAQDNIDTALRRPTLQTDGSGGRRGAVALPTELGTCASSSTLTAV